MFGLLNLQNGFKARLVKVENCGGTVLTIDPNATLSLDSNCNVALVGCGQTTGFKTATVTIGCKIKEYDKNRI